MWIRRTALNEALHELRRPLQALVLAGSAESAGESPGIEHSVQMAASALERLDREINGGAAGTVRTLVVARPLLEASLARWRPRAALAGARLELRWRAGEAILSGDHCGLSQAIDNLLVNAIEHGGSRVVVEASHVGAGLRVAVRDAGRRRPATSVRRRGVAPARRLAARRRHGHGLRVVRRIVADHGGTFELRRSSAGTEAALELPLLVPGERQ